MPCKWLNLLVVTSMSSLLSCSYSAEDRVNLPSPLESPDAECPRDPVYNSRFLFIFVQKL